MEMRPDAEAGLVRPAKQVGNAAPSDDCHPEEWRAIPLEDQRPGTGSRTMPVLRTGK